MNDLTTFQVNQQMLAANLDVRNQDAGQVFQGPTVFALGRQQAATVEDRAERGGGPKKCVSFRHAIPVCKMKDGG